MKHPRNKPSRETLDEILADGFEFVLNYGDTCEVYKKGNERILYDTKCDSVIGRRYNMGKND